MGPTLVLVAHILVKVCIFLNYKVQGEYILSSDRNDEQSLVL